jgi:PleD family two-component response regulator
MKDRQISTFEPATKNHGILIVDDCPEDRERLHQLLSSRTDVEFRIFAAGTAEEALDILDREDVDCLLLDYNLPDADGVEFLSALRGGLCDRNLGIIILTGVGNELVAAEAFRRGADDYLPKPSITKRTLREAVDRTIEQRRHGRKVQDSGI